MKLNCLVVDDEPMARNTVDHFIERTDELASMGACSSAIEASNILKKEKIDILFLDIQMPEMSGMELIKTLQQPPEIILITSNKDYAVEAFEYRVTDYLLKPLKYPRFLQAVEAAKNHLEEKVAEKPDEKYFYVKSGTRIVRLNFEDILFIEALADYVVINTESDKVIIHSTMKDLQKKLPEELFCRTHRSYFVNLKKIDTIEDSAIIIRGNQIPIGASYRDEFMDKIRKMML